MFKQSTDETDIDIDEILNTANYIYLEEHSKVEDYAHCKLINN
jgi:hypothetical protein